MTGSTGFVTGHMLATHQPYFTSTTSKCVRGKKHSRKRPSTLELNERGGRHEVERQCNDDMGDDVLLRELREGSREVRDENRDAREDRAH